MNKMSSRIFLVAIFFWAGFSATGAEAERTRWMRFSVSYMDADDYHDGEGSVATGAYKSGETEYEIVSGMLEGAWRFYRGAYVYGALNLADARLVNPGGRTFDSDWQVRETTLALGYRWSIPWGALKGAAGYTINVDDDFGKTGTLPTSDGSDYLTLSLSS